MLSPQLRQRIFQLWTSFWSSGMTNPLIAIEQITYLLFLHELEGLNDRRDPGKPSLYAPDHEVCRWSHLRAIKDAAQVHDTLTQHVFPWLRGLGNTVHSKWNDDEERVVVAEYLEDAHFQLPREKTGTLERALKTVDDLFAMTGRSSANADLMGDIFEYLLDELRTSGKNGQFRTPRHIIRFMIELLDPEPEARIIDPAAGTGGFLTNAILHHRMKASPELFRLEWDGTPHCLSDCHVPFSRDLLTGFDNDRTMVRIGWMNLILHGVSNPRFEQKDPLGNSLAKEESGAYSYALANPPYSGSVDKRDLNKDRVPHHKNGQPVTDRTELLFLWVMLDLLKPGGRMAVIVPEGTLFGSTGAHRQLRRHLLFRHEVEGIISLPQGVFQPYTNVKTSILIVRKGDDVRGRTVEELEEDETAEPLTKYVWFYEVSSDGYSLGTNRSPQHKAENDLWDALEKWRLRNNSEIVKQEATSYWQPRVHKERWRMVDQALVTLFPDTQPLLDQTKSIQELFPDLFTGQYEDMEAQLRQAETIPMVSVQQKLRAMLLKVIAQQSYARKPLFDPSSLTEDQIEQTVARLRSILLTRSGEYLERREGAGSFSEEHSRGIVEQAIDKLRVDVTRRDELLNLLWQEGVTNIQWAQARSNSSFDDENWADLFKPFARLDGYDVYLRSPEVFKQNVKLDEPKCWVVPVQRWREQPDWVIEDKTVHGSHDKEGQIRREYKDASRELKTGQVKEDFLEQDCIQATDFNLSAGRYKPQIELVSKFDGKTATDLVRELLQLEEGIQADVRTLLLVLEAH